jgi:hypothetical protein
VTNHRLCLLLLTAIVVSLACALPANLSQIISPLPTPTPVRYAIGPDSVNNGLDHLQRYRTQITVDFTGSRNGDTVQTHLETNTEVTQQPSALHHILEIEGTLPHAQMPLGVSEVYRLEDQIYLKKAGDTLWTQFSGAHATPPQFGFFDLERLVVLPQTVSTPPVTATLNGQAVRHFSFTEADLDDPAIIFNRAEGEVWVAPPNEQVVQYTISTSLRVTLPNPQSHLFDQGQLTLQYSLSDVNADFTIDPPANTLTNNVLDNLPRLPDAEIIAAFPNLMEYTSATGAISATQFYQTELTAQDWTEENVSVFEEKARLVFSQDGRTLTIIITPLDNDQTIKVLLDIR